jgi:hypothetical protein
MATSVLYPLCLLCCLTKHLTAVTSTPVDQKGWGQAQGHEFKPQYWGKKTKHWLRERQKLLFI